MVLAAEQARDQVLAEIDVPPKGTKITMTQAARKHGVGVTTIRNWRHYGWINVLHEGTGQGSATHVDEHDVVMVLIDPKRGGSRGPKAGQERPRSFD